VVATFCQFAYQMATMRHPRTSRRTLKKVIILVARFNDNDIDVHLMAREGACLYNIRKRKRVDMFRRGSLFYFGFWIRRLKAPLTRHEAVATGQLIAPLEDAVAVDVDLRPFDPDVLSNEEAAPQEVAPQEVALAPPPQPAVLVQPQAPTAREKELHEATHVPFKPWCELCVAANAASERHGLDHGPVVVDERAVVQFDYMFWNRGGECITWAESATAQQKQTAIRQAAAVSITGMHMGVGYPFATQVRSKGTADKHTIHCIKLWLKVFTDRKIVLQGDAGNALLALLTEVAEERGLGDTVRSVPPDSHASNGGAERANRAISDQVRCMFLALAKMYPTENFGVDHVLFPWAVRQAPWVLARFQPHLGGSTASFAIMGTNYGYTVAPFWNCPLLCAGSGGRSAPCESRTQMV